MYKRNIFFITALLAFTGVFGQSYRVKTVTGDSAGYRNGADTIALFNGPTAIVSDTAGNLYITDTYNNVIRKIWVNDSVSTYAGNDTAGYRDGADTVAEFNMPLGICIDKNGNLYVADTYNNIIRKVDATGKVTTFAGTGVPGFVNGKADSAEFYLPTGVAVDTSGNVFVADNGNFSIREISATGIVTTLAGTGFAGFKNGAGDTAKFNGVYGIAINDSGTLYVTEYLNNDVRKISGGIVSVFAGFSSYPTPTGFRDGKNDTALFNNPTGVMADDSGNVYVCDEYNNRIRKISKGMVTTLAGNGVAGYVDSVDYLSEFNQPYGITLSKGVYYIADNGNNRIRKLISMPPLGTEVIASKGINMLVYPNPCIDKLIVASAPAGKAEMLDVMGREVWSNAHVKAPFIISTSDLTPGVYFLRVSNTSGSAIKKIVIER